MDPRIYEQLHEIERSHWWFVGRRRVLLAALERSGVEATSILDIGCGAGTNLDLLATRYPTIRIHGVDIERDPLRYCRQDRDTPVVQADGGRLPFAAESFDLVCALDTLEHLPDDVSALADFHRICRPGGHVLLTVPAFGFLWGNIDEAGHHHRRYDRGDLLGKVSAAGFSVKFERYFNFLLFPPIAAIRLLARVRPKRRRPEEDALQTDFDVVKSGPLNAALARIFGLEASLLRWKPPAGVSLFCIAERPR